jgi:hypothetical protein
MYIGNAVNVTSSESDYFENAGSLEMAVNGSITPVVFEVTIPDDGKDYALTAIDIALNSAGALQSGQSFLNGLALTNGIEYGFITRKGEIEVPVRGPIKTNIDLFARDSHAVVHSMQGSDVVLTLNLSSGFFLSLSSYQAKSMFMKVNDDLTGAISIQAYAKLYRVIESWRS